MKNTIIFVTSNITMRGPAARNLKAGFFCVSETGVFSTYKAAACLQYRTGKTGNARASVCSTAVFGGPLFLSAYKCRTHHAHRNSHTAGKEKPLQRAADHPHPQRRTRQTHGARIAPFAPGFSAKETPGFNSLSP